MTATDAQSRIASLLTGGSLPASRLAERVKALLEPMRDACGELEVLLDLEIGLAIETTVATADDAPARVFAYANGGHVVRAVVPGTLASWAGSAMLGDARAGSEREAGSLDWHLAPLWLNPLVQALGEGWTRIERPPPPTAETTDARLILHAGELSFPILLHMPPALVMPRARHSSETGARPALATRDTATIALAATLDLRPVDLRRLTRLGVGDIVPLSGGLDDVRLRERDRTLFTAKLGQTSGRYSVRLSNPAHGGEFTAVSPSASPKHGSRERKGGTDAEGEAA